MKLKGKLTREFFGGEVWVLRATDGATYQLTGDIPARLADQQVEVEARPSENSFGVGMVGPIMEARKVRPA